MIETFIRQKITTSDEWFTKAPQYQRAGTDPIEKQLYLDRICSIVGRIETGDVLTRSSGDRNDFKLTAPPLVEANNRQALSRLTALSARRVPANIRWPHSLVLESSQGRSFCTKGNIARLCGGWSRTSSPSKGRSIVTSLPSASLVRTARTGREVPFKSSYLMRSITASPAPARKTGTFSGLKAHARKFRFLTGNRPKELDRTPTRLWPNSPA